MKVQPARAEALCANPDPALRVLLLYGPDQGLVRERARAATRAVLGAGDDPFRLAELIPKQVRDDPALLYDEAAALALTGGRRVVRMRDLTNDDAKWLEPFLAELPGEALVVLEAGDLGSARASKLVRLAEGHAAAAAVACYRDEGRDLPRLIDEVLGAAGLRAEPDARAYLAANLGGDRLVSRSELDKLVTYMGGDTRVGLAEAAAVVGDTAALSLQDVAYAVGRGDAAALERALARSFDEGTSPVGVLRAVSRHFQQLHLAAAELARGRDAEGVLRQMRPPVFWKLKEAFLAQARAWPPAWLGRALTRLLEAEAACKRSGLPDRAVCAEALLALARNAPARRRASGRG